MNRYDIEYDRGRQDFRERNRFNRYEQEGRRFDQSYPENYESGEYGRGRDYESGRGWGESGRMGEGFRNWEQRGYENQGYGDQGSWGQPYSNEYRSQDWGRQYNREPYGRQ